MTDYLAITISVPLIEWIKCSVPLIAIKYSDPLIV